MADLPKMNEERARLLKERILGFKDCLDDIRLSIYLCSEDTHCSFSAEHNVKAKRALRGIACAWEDMLQILKYLDEYASNPDSELTCRDKEASDEG